MNKIEIRVPVAYKYLSEWHDLLNQLPQSGKYIINKVRTGCGGTTLFLESQHPCILVSPRINMLLSKYKQYPDTFLFCSVDGTSIQTKKEKLKSYIESCTNQNPWGQNNRTPIILTTVDSYKHVAEQLNYLGILDKFNVLVDEFQCLMSDAAFKGNVGLTFLHNLTGIKSVCYLSATPIPEDYLSEMDDFKDVENYYQLVWDASVLEPSNLLSVPYKKGESSQSICKQIIEGYRKNGYFAQKVVNNRVVQSHEVCIFLNDVGSIIRIIKENKLNPDDVNVLCSQSNTGITTLKMMKVHIGELCTDSHNPHNRTFTFCTKATFEGVDFYSDNAYTYIFSDGILDWNKHDLIIDVPQILGRQRLASNPFRTDATLYYRIKSTTESLEDAKKRIGTKEANTEKWINCFKAYPYEVQEILVRELRKRDPEKRYEEDYVDIVDDTINGGFTIRPNYLMRNVEIRDWELSNYVYSSPIYLISTIEKACIQASTEERDVLLLQFKEQFFNNQRSISKQLEIYCSFLQRFPTFHTDLLANPHIPLFFHEAYSILGPAKLSALQYREKDIVEAINHNKSKKEISQQCASFFQKGKDYPLSEVKAKLQFIYSKLGLSQTAKASDLGEYMSISQRQLTSRTTGKRVQYYHIE